MQLFTYAAELVRVVDGDTVRLDLDLGFYEWSGSTIEYHRAQIRRHLGFRECTAEDAGKLTEWLAASVCQAEHRCHVARASRRDPIAEHLQQARVGVGSEDMSRRASQPQREVAGACSDLADEGGRRDLESAQDFVGLLPPGARGIVQLAQVLFEIFRISKALVRRVLAHYGPS